MLLVVGVEGDRVQQLDIRFGCEDCGCPDVLLAFVLGVPLNDFLDFKQTLLRKVFQHRKRLWLPPNRVVVAKQPRNVRFRSLVDLALINHAALRADQVGVVLLQINLVQGRAANDLGFLPLLFAQQIAFDRVLQLVFVTPNQDLAVCRSAH